LLGAVQDGRHDSRGQGQGHQDQGEHPPRDAPRRPRRRPRRAIGPRGLWLDSSWVSGQQRAVQPRGEGWIEGILRPGHGRHRRPQGFQTGSQISQRSQLAVLLIAR